MSAQSQLEKEEERLEQDYRRGLIRREQYMSEILDLQREYQEAARETAQQVYERESIKQSDDSEFQTFTAEAKYRYWERIGMTCEDRPVTAEADAIARQEAREWDKHYESSQN